MILGRGVGAALTEWLLRYIDNMTRPGAFVGLLAAIGASGFYRRFGFAERPTERQGMYCVY